MKYLLLSAKCQDTNVTPGLALMSYLYFGKVQRIEAIIKTNNNLTLYFISVVVRVIIRVV